LPFGKRYFKNNADFYSLILNFTTMENISIFVNALFVITTLYVVAIFYKAAAKLKTVLLVLVVWMLLLTALGLTGFYQETNVFPPRFIFLIGPGILVILALFLTEKGRAFIDSLSLKQLTLLHIARIPVEITLYYICLARLIPVTMTFEGYNYDILSGITAAVIYYIAFISQKGGYKILLVWNFICLGLLLNVVIIAILSAQTPFQRLAFDQPNTGVTYFPYVWLPGVIVPLVLLSHLAGIRQLLLKLKRNHAGKPALL
jgi:hypothetical protein